MNSLINTNLVVEKINYDTEILSPYHYSKYDFITENKVDIKDAFIQYAEQVINRAENQLFINKFVNDIEKSIKIELSIFEYSLLYCINNNIEQTFLKSIYDDKILNILVNLDPKSKLKNKTLLSNILYGNIDPSHVGFLSPNQIDPDKWVDIIKKKEYREWRENNISYSDAYKCSKCGQRKSKVSLAQTRSADEPMTIFVSCLVCYNTFKFS
jgi:DNA-directed RNA polymerase subunit M/transcription elongation factor TFIIS